MDPIAPGTPIRRHGLATRLWHWINAVAVIVLLGSGLGISNAHPRLYWGRYCRGFLRGSRSPRSIISRSRGGGTCSSRWCSASGCSPI
jgi:hypothetical protein